MHRITYRIRNIPVSWSVDHFRTNFLIAAGIGDGALLRIRSFSSDVARCGRLPRRVAIVSLGVPLLAFQRKHFVLEAGVVKLGCDTVFD